MRRGKGGRSGPGLTSGAAWLLAAAGLLTLAPHAALAGSGAAKASRPAPHQRVVQRHAAERATVADATAPVAFPYASGVRQVGVASYYGPRHNGHRTASGGTFDQTQLTAAHHWLPFGTKVRVIDRSTGRQVVVTINDRLGTNRRIIDLSLGAARELGIVHRGLASVELSAL